MGGGNGSMSNLKGSDAEDMCSAGSLEPDPRYETCCSNVCTPGRIVRDMLVGLLVVVGIAAIVASIFAVCFFLVPEERKFYETEVVIEGAEEVIGGPPPTTTPEAAPEPEPESHPDHITKVEPNDLDKYDIPSDNIEEKPNMPHAETEKPMMHDHNGHTHNHGDHDHTHDHGGHDHSGHTHDHNGHDHSGHTHDHSGHDHSGHNHDHADHMHDDFTEHVPTPSVSAVESSSNGINLANVGLIGHNTQQSTELPSTTEKIMSTSEKIMPPSTTIEVKTTTAAQTTTTTETIAPLFDILGQNNPSTPTVLIPSQNPIVSTQTSSTTEKFNPNTGLPVVLGTCLSKRLTMCDSVSTWDYTSFPNWINDTTSLAAQQSSSYFNDIIINSRCSPRALEFTCAVLEPSCDTNGLPIPPCKAVCRSVASTCSEFLIKNLPQNIAFDCERYPDSEDPTICVDLSKATYPPPPDSILELIESEKDYDYAPIETVQELSGGPITLPSQESNNQSPYEQSDNEYPDYLSGDTEYSGSNITETNNYSTLEEYPVDNRVIEDRLDAVAFPFDESDVGASEQPLATEEVEPLLICNHDKFLCDDGSDCITTDKICDGQQHCFDASDENNCTTTAGDINQIDEECGTDDFKCATTPYCLPRSWVCDGADDCRDNSDEINCNLDLINDPVITDLEDNIVPDASISVQGYTNILPYENSNEPAGVVFKNDHGFANIHSSSEQGLSVPFTPNSYLNADLPNLHGSSLSPFPGRNNPGFSNNGRLEQIGETIGAVYTPNTREMKAFESDDNKKNTILKSGKNDTFEIPSETELKEAKVKELEQLDFEENIEEVDDEFINKTDSSEILRAIAVNSDSKLLQPVELQTLEPILNISESTTTIRTSTEVSGNPVLKDISYPETSMVNMNLEETTTDSPKTNSRLRGRLQFLNRNRRPNGISNRRTTTERSGRTTDETTESTETTTPAIVRPTTTRRRTVFPTRNRSRAQNRPFESARLDRTPNRPTLKLRTSDSPAKKPLVKSLRVPNMSRRINSSLSLIRTRTRNTRLRNRRPTVENIDTTESDTELSESEDIGEPDLLDDQMAEPGYQYEYRVQPPVNFDRNSATQDSGSTLQHRELSFNEHLSPDYTNDYDQYRLPLQTNRHAFLSQRIW